MAAVEFAILGTVFCLILGGIIDFGHAWYLKQLVTNASREGARYGVAYTQVAGTATRALPSSLDISGYVTTLLPGATVNPSDGDSTDSDANGPVKNGYSTGIKAHQVKVTVRVAKNWFMLRGFLPGVTLPATLSASTTMLVE